MKLTRKIKIFKFYNLKFLLRFAIYSEDNFIHIGDRK